MPEDGVKSVFLAAVGGNADTTVCCDRLVMLDDRERHSGRGVRSWVLSGDVFIAQDSAPDGRVHGCKDIAPPDGDGVRAGLKYGV